MGINKLIYADNASTTEIFPEALQAMLPYFTSKYGNPSSIYPYGQNARKALESARKTLADIFSCHPGEICFTSGGTESNNWAILGAASAMKSRGKSHIITTEIEHSSVLEPCKHLEQTGFNVTYLPADKNGLIDPSELERNITEKTGLVSVMYVNNETGSIQPISDIGQICKKHNVAFHTDGIQATGKLEINPSALNIDLLSLSSHKTHGPKGAGALYISKDIQINNLLYGGRQENSRRSGTENTAGIIGFVKAIETSYRNLASSQSKVKRLEEILLKGISNIDGAFVIGDENCRLPGILNLIIPGIDSEALVLMLGIKGICISGGSACTSGTGKGSHVLEAIGYKKLSKNGVRISLSSMNSTEDVKAIVRELPLAVNRLKVIM